jgi:PAS domain S-box-containing protein
MTSDPRPPVLPQAVLDAMPGAVAQLSPDGAILGVNAAWRTLAASIRFPPGTNVTVGANYLAFCDRAAAAGVFGAAQTGAALRHVLNGGEPPPPIEFTGQDEDRPHRLEFVVTRLDGDGYGGALIVLTDVTVQHAAADAQRRSESRYRDIFESAPVGIYQVDSRGQILAANQCLAAMVGAASAQELVGTPTARFDVPGKHVEPPADGTPVEMEWNRLDGVHIWVQVAARAIVDGDGHTVYREGFVFDISERKRLEAQLLQAQKMESVGRLAGGIAHDFNNLLTVMIGYAELLHTSGDIPAPLRSAASEILDAARRAAQLTGRMLAFARKGRVQPRAVQVNRLVRDVEGLLRRIIGEDVQLEVSLAPDLPPVLIDPAQFEQVLMNLAVNARDAMPKGGVLTISTGLVDVTAEDARRRPGLRRGRQVQISMADTGIGMDEETLARIFEPFFTTKEPGKGTGLGLAMCYGIVKQAHGFIGCDSVKGAGTTCTVFLPATSAVEVPQSPPERRTEATAEGPTRAATVLVVEDESVVRHFVTDVLTAAGHIVFATGSPEEGIALAAKHRVDLLVTDVVMPQMDGMTLASRIAEVHPTVRVLMMSGYDARPAVEPEAARHVLGKPFTAAQLRERVDDLLRS